MKFVANYALAFLAFTVVFSSFNSAEAKRRNRKEQIENSDQSSKEDSSSQGTQAVDNNANDSDIVRAVNEQRRVNFVEGGGMVVTKVLPDDNNGLKHQKWVVRLSNGKTMQAVYNSDMCPRVPVKVGDVVAMGGMFLWTNTGALLHWLHHDPRGNRPDGYVYVNGKYYCKD
ncbi:DUF3465 domain-containing protein [Bdellovibrio sp. HCB-162]|uniref:DUF3465 domain-containing protein n=1 Tax=Bdellovibrio sp. HCB-162 TaxID=3394234 RepID=UPI0039BC4169